MGLFSTTEKTSQTQTQNQNTTPWAAQIPYLSDAFQKAQANYNTGAGSVYSGNQVAQYTPDQMNVFAKMLGYGLNSNAPQTSADVGATLANTGATGLSTAMERLLAFKPTGGTQSNIDAATSYADNPYINSQVDASLRDAQRYAFEQAIPGIRRDAAANGNVNANTTGVNGLAEGVVRRGLADQAGDVSAALRGQAYESGLNRAETGRQFDNTAALDALKSTGTFGTAAANTGVNALTSAINQQGSLFDLAGAGAGGQQLADQASIDNAKARAEYPTDRLNALLQQYFATIGNPNYGGSTTGTSTTQGTTTKDKSTAEGIAGIVGSLAAMAKK